MPQHQTASRFEPVPARPALGLLSVREVDAWRLLKRAWGAWREGVLRLRVPAAGEEAAGPRA